VLRHECARRYRTPRKANTAPVVVGQHPATVIVARPSGPISQPVHFGGSGIQGGPAMHFGRR
jgi:hypothetical protein